MSEKKPFINSHHIKDMLVPDIHMPSVQKHNSFKKQTEKYLRE